MAPKEPTRHQISSRLAYSQNTPSFLLKLQNRIAGIPNSEDEDEDDNFEPDDGSGRPPIPRRPAIPERPKDDPRGSADEDDGEMDDEKPLVVVLREGKHLTEREAENVKRKEKGLAPLPDPAQAASNPATLTEVGSSKEAAAVKARSENPKQSLSFSSNKGGFKSSAGKRKAVGEPEEDKGAQKTTGKKVKKVKKASKTLLSFGDDA